MIWPQPRSATALALTALLAAGCAAGASPVRHGIATTGCATLPPGGLLPLLRWLNPARLPRIRMGVR